MFLLITQVNTPRNKRDYYVNIVHPPCNNVLPPPQISGFSLIEDNRKEDTRKFYDSIFAGSHMRGASGTPSPQLVQK